MSWNYRMIRIKEGKDIVFNVHEVYYDKKGKATSFSENPMYAQGANPAELFEDLCFMQKAFHSPAFEIKENKLIEIEVNKITGKNK